MKRSAQATWSGGLKEGKGLLTTASGALSATPFTLASLADENQGTSSGELLAAAQAGCVTMTLAGLLDRAGMSAQQIETRAELTLDKTATGWVFTAIQLRIRARIANADPEKFKTLAEAARKKCPVSRALNIPVAMEIELDS